MKYRNISLGGLQAACILAATLTLTACDRHPDKPMDSTTAPSENSSSPASGGATSSPMTPDASSAVALHADPTRPSAVK